MYRKKKDLPILHKSVHAPALSNLIFWEVPVKIQIKNQNNNINKPTKVN